MMKKLLLLSCFCFAMAGETIGQIPLPYFNSFNLPSDTVGWSHYAITGTDDWNWGPPTAVLLATAPSPPNAWGTNLAGATTINSKKVLESPSFDFSGPSRYALVFNHKHAAVSGSGGNIEFSTNSGATWNLLNGPAGTTSNWYTSSMVTSLGQPGWSGSFYYVPKVSMIDLTFLKDSTNVRFRFKFGTSTTSTEGWLIDDLSIQAHGPNVAANVGVPMTASAFSPSLIVESALSFSALFPVTFTNQTDYFFSVDSLYDVTDVYLGSKSQSISGSIPVWRDTVSLPPGLVAGSYFVLYKHDAANVLTETTESDNWSYLRLNIDTTIGLPCDFGFEAGFQGWKPGGPVTWANTPGIMYDAQGVHTGYNGLFVNNGNISTSYVESDFLDFNNGDANCICHWAHEGSPIDLKYSLNNGYSWTPMSGTVLSNGYDWDFKVFEPGTVLDTCKYVKLRYYGSTSAMDDIHIGKCAPDLSIAIDRKNRFTTTAYSTDTISYFIMNSGTRSCPATQTKFYWSADTLFDGTDVFLGSKSEATLLAGDGVWSSFTFSKPTLSPGVYYLFYVLDATSSVLEMVETNDTGYVFLHQPQAKTVPYYNDFETQIDGWHHKTNVGYDQWVWTTPGKVHLDTAFSGTKAWVSNDTGIVLPYSRFFLYTTVFDLSAATTPVLEFDMKLHGHFSLNAVVNMSYSTDDGMTWTVLDTMNKSWNKWYYPYKYQSGNGYDVINSVPFHTDLFFEPFEGCFTSVIDYNSRNVRRNTRYNTDISFLAGEPKVQFRFNLATGDNADSTYGLKEGALIDNFSIREAFVDLTIKDRKSMMFGPIDSFLTFNVDIFNAGNYLANRGSVGAYLSVDSLLDGGDLYLGSQATLATKPDWYQYLTLGFPSPGSLVGYGYLLLKADQSNSVIESDETNNVMAWPLSIVPFKSFPYFEQFEDSILSGWHYRSMEAQGIDTINQHRFRWRNILTFGEPPPTTGLVSGQMFTDWINPVTSIMATPYSYLEGPTFDFSASDSISMTFDLLCTGATSPSSADDGGNMDYTTDGGVTWNLLTDLAGTATNWYNVSVLDNLYDQAGWSQIPLFPSGVVSLPPRSIDISFLAGQPHVKFRFKYRSKHSYFGTGYPMGMRIDNFRISANTITDIDALHSPKPIFYVSGEKAFFDSRTGKSGHGELKVLDNLGKTVYSANISIADGMNTYELPASLPNGIYIVQIRENEGRVSSKRYLHK